ncbi:STAS domain-containing protein [Geobacter pelophilus]|jgi:anti-anti-sigma factor|uniref:STAS domain-containing protein n=1 Tax=Geoanaerobacter pelophilus TaxID=60036 RepID=A0AAW4L367_9BACT|nr:STAS domain-containing protein [Geoanaerobacter pelophilus]MBT0662676.1 STAS domain-containing protein [Geoanaerobacter pelophilus]
MDEFAANNTGAPDDLVVHLSGSMTIHYAVEIKDALLTAFNDSSKLTCNLTQVSDIDLAGLQLLCATHKSSCASGRKFEVVGLERDDFVKVVECAGFSRHIGCMQNEANRCIWVGGAQ